jgi:hypothetical protein
MGAGPSSGAFSLLFLEEPFWLCSCALFATRLLYAGQPLHPSAPPVPLHRPPPGQDPVGIWSAATYVAPATFPVIDWAQGFGDVFSGDFLGTVDTVVGGRFKLVGRDEFRALRYRPQALQMVAP